MELVLDLTKLDEVGCLGAPDMIVELSPSTAKHDWHFKFDTYEYRRMSIVLTNRIHLLGFQTITNYFDALINKTEITEIMERRFRDAVICWGREVIANLYRASINQSDVNNYAGRTEYFDFLTKNVE